MIKMEFGIIDHIDLQKDYSSYEPQKNHCIMLDDDLYMNDWCIATWDMPTYFHQIDRPSCSFARWGVTLIPPTSLPQFLKIVQTTKHNNVHPDLKALKRMIYKAIKENKFIIHFGV